MEIEGGMSNDEQGGNELAPAKTYANLNYQAIGRLYKMGHGSQECTAAEAIRFLQLSPQDFHPA